MAIHELAWKTMDKLVQLPWKESTLQGPICESVRLLYIQVNIVLRHGEPRTRRMEHWFEPFAGSYRKLTP